MLASAAAAPRKPGTEIATPSAAERSSSPRRVRPEPGLWSGGTSPILVPFLCPISLGRVATRTRSATNHLGRCAGGVAACRHSNLSGQQYGSPEDGVKRRSVIYDDVRLRSLEPRVAVVAGVEVGYRDAGEEVGDRADLRAMVERDRAAENHDRAALLAAWRSEGAVGRPLMSRGTIVVLMSRISKRDSGYVKTVKFAFRKFVVGAGTLALFGGMASTALAAQHGPTLSPARGLGFAPHAHAGSGVQKAARSGLGVSDALKRRLVAKQQRPPFNRVSGVGSWAACSSSRPRSAAAPPLSKRATAAWWRCRRAMGIRSGRNSWQLRWPRSPRSMPTRCTSRHWAVSCTHCGRAMARVRWRFAVGAA